MDHPSFCDVKSRKILNSEREVILALIWTISSIASHRHLINSGGTHDPCYVRTVGRTGQFVGLVCSSEGLDELNDMNVYLKCGL